MRKSVNSTPLTKRLNSGVKGPMSWGFYVLIEDCAEIKAYRSNFSRTGKNKQREIVIRFRRLF